MSRTIFVDIKRTSCSRNQVCVKQSLLDSVKRKVCYMEQTQHERIRKRNKKQWNWKYKQLYANEYTIQQPIDSSDQNWAKLNTAYSGQTDICSTTIRISVNDLSISQSYTLWDGVGNRTYSLYKAPICLPVLSTGTIATNSLKCNITLCFILLRRQCPKL